MNNDIRAAIYGMLGILAKNLEWEARKASCGAERDALNKQIRATLDTQASYVECLPTPDDGPE